MSQQDTYAQVTGHRAFMNLAAAYVAACHAGDSRLQRILAQRLSDQGIDADAEWDAAGNLIDVILQNAN